MDLTDEQWAAVEGREAVCLVAELPAGASRYERYLTNYLGFAQLGCAVILLRNYF